MSKFIFWISKKRVFIPLIFFVIYHILFNSFTGQILFDNIIAGIARKGAIHANVDRFSLFYGVELTSVEVSSGDKFANSKILNADRISILYSLPSALLGRLSIREIGLDNPKVHLIEKDGVWNFDDVLIPKSSTQEEEGMDEEEDFDEEEEPADSFSLPIPISVYAKLTIQDLDFRLTKESDSLDLGLKGFHLNFLLDSYRFSELPYDLTALELIDALYFDINPNSPVGIFFSNPELSLDSPWNFSISIHKDGKQDKFILESRSKIGGDNISFQKKNGSPVYLNFNLEHNLSYIPEQDSILLDHFLVSFQKETWLKIQGDVGKPFSPDRNMRLNLDESLIRLKTLSDFLAQLPLPAMNLGGVLRLSPLSVSGPTKDLTLDWQAEAKDVYYQSGNTKFSSKFLNLDITAGLDLDTDQKPTAKNPIPLLKRLNIRNLRAEYNGLVVNLRGVIQPTSNIDLSLELDRLQIQSFVKNLFGSLTAKLHITGSDMSSLNANADIKLSAFRFFMNRSQSGFSHNSLKTNLTLLFNKPFGLSGIDIGELNLKMKNASGKQAVLLSAKAKLNLMDGLNIKLKKSTLDGNLSNLIPILPLSLKEKVVPIESKLSSEIGLDVSGEFDIKNKSYIAYFSGRLPGIDLKDLKGNVDLRMSDSNPDLELKTLSLRAYGDSLGLDLRGKLYEKAGEKDPPIGPYFGNLDMELFLRSDTEKPIGRGFKYRGNTNLKAKINDNILEGMLISENTKILINQGECPGVNCKLYLIENLNADIPVHHNLTKKSGESLIEGDKSRFIKTYGRIPRDNISIYQVIGSHPSISGLPFSYVKASGNYPGLTGRIQYRENYLIMDGLKFSLLDGMVYGKDFLINVGSGDPEKMEFMGSLQVRDIDLKQLLSKSAQNSIDDGKIKADLNLSGVNLSDPIPNLNLYFSIFQIGRDFGKSALNVISTKGVLMNYITDSYAVDKVEVELSKGLVYADVLFKKSLLSYMVSLEDSKLSQQRMPLANFLKRAESEIATYR